MLGLNKGELFIEADGKTVPFTGINSFIAEDTKFNDKEIPSKKTYRFTSNASFEAEINYMDWPSFDALFPKSAFILEYNIPIMIQARWHKKARIRKKWLKRYGMKSDAIKAKCNATNLEYEPGHILEEQHDCSGICATFDSFTFETDSIEYIFRPDQKRKDIKIEWR